MTPTFTEWLDAYLYVAPLEAWQRNRLRVEDLWRGGVPERPVVRVQFPARHTRAVPEGAGAAAEHDLAAQVVYGFGPDEAAARAGLDNAPVLSPFRPVAAAGTHYLAAILGARVRHTGSTTDNWGAWVDPLLSTPGEVKDLSRPDLAENPWTAPVFERARDLAQLAHGAFPVDAPVAGSPLDAAADLMGAQQLMTALYDSPRQVEALLALLTDINIEFCLRLREAAGDWAGYGGGRSGPVYVHDLLARFIPDRFQEQFLLPSYERMGKELGGLAFGFNGHSLEAMARFAAFEGFAGLWVPTLSFPYEDMARVLGSRGVWMFYSHTPEAHVRYLPAAEYAGELARFRGTVAQMVNIQINAHMYDGPNAEERALCDGLLVKGLPALRDGAPACMAQNLRQ